MSDTHTEELKSVADGQAIPDKLTKYASRIRNKKEDERTDDEKEYLEAYNYRMSQSSTYFKNVTEYRTNKTEINENSVKIASIDAEEKYFKRFAEFADSALKAGKQEYPTIIKKLHKIIDTLMKVVEGQATYIEGLQTSALENEKARNDNFKEVMKLKEKTSELQGMIDKNEEEEGGLAKMLEGENLSKLKDVLDMVKAAG